MSRETSSGRSSSGAAPSLAPGQTFAGRYRVISHLGSGGMGDVYEVEHVLLGKRFAIKRLSVEGEDDQARVERFLREARTAAATGHPGVVDVVDVGFAEDELPYLVMERLEGETLRRRLDRGGAVGEAMLKKIAHRVLDALGAVHAAGIVHRDLKPENLFLCRDGRLVILDFGLSHDAAVDVRLTRSGAVMGTPLYMAPEQARGEDVDARTDLYAVGAVLYECAAGRPPFAAPAYSVLVAMILEQAPEAEPLAGLGAEVREMILRALAKPVDARPRSAAEMREAFGEEEEEGGWEAPPEERPRQDRGLTTAPTIASEPGGRAKAATPAVTKRERPAKPGAVRTRSTSTTRWWWVVAAAGVVGAAAVVATRGGSTTAPAVQLAVTGSRRLTLQPGCEEYPRFTPDGQRVVYDGVVDGDSEILARAVEGGEVERLTRATGWDYAPAIAPDGTRVAYVHEDTAGRTLRVVGIGGDQAGPTVDLGRISGYPAWTRDGALLVGDPGGRIVRRELASDGSVDREVVLGRLPAGARPYHLVDVEGAGVAVLWWTSSDADAAALGELDRDGTLRVIEEATVDYDGGIAASAGARGYYATRKGVATGNQLLWRPWGGGAPEVVPGGIAPRAGVDVARDGKRIAWSTCTETPYVVRLREGVEVLSRGEWQDTTPVAIAPDRVLIGSNRLGSPQAWILDLDGGARAVTPPESRAASPSRDGTRIVYAADGIAIVDVGGEPRRLTDDPSDTSPVFTGDGRQVVFVRSVGGVSTLHVVDSDGGAARALVAGSQPATAPRGDGIAFVADAGVTGARQILITDGAGATPRPVPGLAAAAWQRPRFSPDGTRLLAIRGYQELVEAPLDGATPPVVRWTTTTESLLAADWAPDGDGFVASLGEYRGDLWIADGVFR